LAAHAASVQPYWPYPVGVLGWLDSFLRSLGIILFSPRSETGAAVFAALLFWSPAMAVSGVVGWIAGILTAKVLADFGFNWLWLIAADNSFITAMMLGAVFHLASRSTLAISALAGIGAAVLALAVQTAFRGTGWAFQPLPAVLTTWIVLLALSGRSARHPIVATGRPDLAPEPAWQQARLFEARFGAPAPLVAVPLAGMVAVSQGFNGPISHRGSWRQGLDFELPTEPGAGGGLFGAPVYCPTDGMVESVATDIPDNALGMSNYSQNWGNYILIRMDQGLWLMLAHLAKDSIKVAAGQRVRAGQVIGASAIQAAVQRRICAFTSKPAPCRALRPYSSSSPTIWVTPPAP
jgi:murein DD-endopeptidase MepM/ murein hydrolase activator NlpD